MLKDKLCRVRKGRCNSDKDQPLRSAQKLANASASSASTLAPLIRPIVVSVSVQTPQSPWIKCFVSGEESSRCKSVAPVAPYRTAQAPL